MLLSASEVSSVLADCHALLQLPDDQLDPRDKPASGTRHLRELDRRLPLVGDIVQRASLHHLIEQIVGPDHVLQQAEFRCPQSGFGGQKLHTDWLPLDASSHAQVATVIVALVDFTDTNGATRIIPGSHRRPDLQRAAGRLESHPDELVLVGDAGTAFVFSGHLMHAGGTNLSPAERPALQLIYHRST